MYGKAREPRGEGRVEEKRFRTLLSGGKGDRW